MDHNVYFWFEVQKYKVQSLVNKILVFSSIAISIYVM